MTLLPDSWLHLSCKKKLQQNKKLRTNKFTKWILAGIKSYWTFLTVVTRLNPLVSTISSVTWWQHHLDRSDQIRPEIITLRYLNPYASTTRWQILHCTFLHHCTAQHNTILLQAPQRPKIVAICHSAAPAAGPGQPQGQHSCSPLGGYPHCTTPFHNPIHSTSLNYSKLHYTTPQHNAQRIFTKQVGYAPPETFFKKS